MIEWSTQHLVIAALAAGWTLDRIAQWLQLLKQAPKDENGHRISPKDVYATVVSLRNEFAAAERRFDERLDRFVTEDRAVHERIVQRIEALHGG